jgi:hypothetical protein
MSREENNMKSIEDLREDIKKDYLLELEEDIKILIKSSKDKDNYIYFTVMNNNELHQCIGEEIYEELVTSGYFTMTDYKTDDYIRYKIKVKL